VKKIASTVCAIAAFLAATAIPLSAHHGSAGYDMEKELTMKATVTQWLWANPHCFLKFDATDEKGEVIHWAAEVSNPIDMTKRGWSKGSLKLGDEVTVTIRPAKNGAPVAQLLKIVLPSGQTLVGWSPSVR
jgi:Family of unknown function (DUF6152)